MKLENTPFLTLKLTADTANRQRSKRQNFIQPQHFHQCVHHNFRVSTVLASTPHNSQLHPLLAVHISNNFHSGGGSWIHRLCCAIHHNEYACWWGPRSAPTAQGSCFERLPVSKCSKIGCKARSSRVHLAYMADATHVLNPCHLPRCGQKDTRHLYGPFQSASTALENRRLLA